MRLLIAAAFLYGAFAQEKETLFDTDGGELFGNVSDFNSSDFNSSIVDFNSSIVMEPGPVIIDNESGADICTYSPNITCFPNTDGFPPCCANSTCTSEYPPCEEPATMGDNICTYAPDETCWPSTNGWPSCCADPNSCPSPTEFIAGVNPPCEEVPGSDICTYSPNITCFPNTDGFPPCCSNSTCTSEYPPCEEPATMGDNICTYAPDETCWPSTNGWPSCCADPNSCPSPTEFIAGVNPPCEEVPGSDICTYSPNITCFPNTDGFPPCCSNSTCTSEYPPCEEPATMGDNICTYAPDENCWPNTNGRPSCCADPNSSCPSPTEFIAGVNPPCEELTGSEPEVEPQDEWFQPKDGAQQSSSSYTFFGLSLITLVGANAFAIVAGMW